MSGGLGIEGHYEAEVMKKYLLDHRVPAGDIIVDNFGNTTFLSAVNYRLIQSQQKFKSVIVVTQFYHITRSKLILRKMGISKVYLAHADYFESRDFYSLFREFFAFYQYLVQ